MFELAVVALDTPTHFDGGHELLERDLDRQGGEPIMGGLGCIFWPFELEAGDRLRRPGQLRVLRARSASSARSADGLASHRFADVTIDKFTDFQMIDSS